MLPIYAYALLISLPPQQISQTKCLALKKKKWKNKQLLICSTIKRSSSVTLLYFENVILNNAVKMRVSLWAQSHTHPNLTIVLMTADTGGVCAEQAEIYPGSVYYLDLSGWRQGQKRESCFFFFFARRAFSNGADDTRWFVMGFYLK